jgi:hypothetical protein
MKRKESKIPLILTVLVLGFFVFWAMGYIRRNRTNPPITEPIEAQAKAPERMAPPPAPMVVAKEPQAVPQQPVATHTATQGAQPTAVFYDPEAADHENIPIQPVNKKIAGMTQAATQRH